MQLPKSRTRDSSSHLKAKLRIFLPEMYESCGPPMRWQKRMQRLRVSKSDGKKDFLRSARRLRKPSRNRWLLLAGFECNRDLSPIIGVHCAKLTIFLCADCRIIANHEG